MKAILIPVKEFSRSKERLAPYYSEDERAALARALCEDTFKVIAQVRGVDRIYVISGENHALGLARQLGWRTISESEQISESASVDTASRLCAAEGVQALLRLPIDIPLVTLGDIEALFAELEPAPSIVIVPSRDGNGTNALLRSPPDMFPSHFGPNSFVLHLDEAERVRARIKIVRNERIGLDIDEPPDVEALKISAISGSAVAHWLAEQEKIGLKRGTVSLVKHHEEWNEALNSEASSLRTIVGAALVDVQHVGSTAVAGLAAKPIIDIAVSVRHLSDVDRFRGSLERAGYTYRANGSDESKTLFVKGPEERRTHHLHIVEHGGSAWNSFIAFRDALRVDPTEVEKYEALKQTLARQFSGDRNSYTAGKRQYIDSVVAKAIGKEQ
jgi:2-phospho-L-lactate guanylyltransferase